MAKFKCKLGPKGKKQAVGPTPIQLPPTGTIDIFLDPVDANGNDVPVTDAANHQATLTADNAAAFVITKGVDTLHYTAVVPAGTPASTRIALSATDHAVDGSFPDLAASQEVVTPPTPPTLPVDMKINITFGP